MSVGRFIFSILAAIALLQCMTPVSARPTTDSALRCQPDEVLTNQNVTCFIYVLDELQEPTTIYSTKDFVARVSSQLSGALVYVSPLTITADPTVVQFSISANSGTVLSVAVSLAATYLPIRDSGQVISVLGAVESLGELKCNQGQLALRDTVQCVANVYGVNGIPAMVRLQDLFFSEDHNTGSFVVIRGNGQLAFNFTAPSSLPMNFTNFRIRVSLVGSAQFLYQSFPVLYPHIPPTARSVLKCLDGFPLLCFVNSADNIGPVFFEDGRFRVAFERQIVDSTASGSGFPSAAAAAAEGDDGSNDPLLSDNTRWIAFTDDMKYDWRASTAGSATKVLKFSVKKPDEVFSIRLRVFSTTGKSASASSSDEEIVGSPFTFLSGLPPTPDECSFRRCTKMFLTSYESTECIIDVAPDAMADPRYFTIKALGGGRIDNIHFASTSSSGAGAAETAALSSASGNIIYFLYTAPGVKKRLAETISISIGSNNVARSPVSLVVYPPNSGASSTYDAASLGDQRPKELALGLSFFGVTVFIAIVVYCIQKHREAIVARERRRKAQARGEDALGSCGGQEMSALQDKEDAEKKAYGMANFGGSYYDLGSTAGSMETLSPLKASPRGEGPSFPDDISPAASVRTSRPEGNNSTEPSPHKGGEGGGGGGHSSLAKQIIAFGKAEEEAAAAAARPQMEATAGPTPSVTKKQSSEGGQEMEERKE